MGKVFSGILRIHLSTCSTINRRMQSFERWNKHIMVSMCTYKQESKRRGSGFFNLVLHKNHVHFILFKRGPHTYETNAIQCRTICSFQSLCDKEKDCKGLEVWRSWNEISLFLQSWFSNHFCVNTNPFGHKIQGKAIDNLAAQAHKEKGVDLTKKKIVDKVVIRTNEKRSFC